MAKDDLCSSKVIDLRNPRKILVQCSGPENCLKAMIREDDQGRYVIADGRRISLPTEGAPSLITAEGEFLGLCAKEMELH